jgi:proline dehydrogenase
MALLDRAFVRVLPTVPRGLVRRLSSRYIAGPALEDAVRVVRRLNAEAKLATIDVLGEEIHDAAAAREIALAYHRVFARIDDERLDANVSIKLTALGLQLDEALCRLHVEGLVRDAYERANFVRIDMEDSSTTDATLRLYRELRAAGHENVGVVLQARLHRTLADARGLPNVRLCKGIYLEGPAIAYRDADEIRASFRATLAALLDQGSYVGIATHDEVLIGDALRQVRERGLRREQYEFQMLLGVDQELREILIAAGHRLRVYVPYGRDWYPYSIRRLRENPEVARHVLRALVARR